MTDEDLAGAVLQSMRDADNPTQVVDVREVAKAHGIDDHYQAQRVAMRLRDQGFIAEEAFTAPSLLATLTERGRRALDTGEYRQITERAVTALEGDGQTAEATKRDHADLEQDRSP